CKTHLPTPHLPLSKAALRATWFLSCCLRCRTAKSFRPMCWRASYGGCAWAPAFGPLRCSSCPCRPRISPGCWPLPSCPAVSCPRLVLLPFCGPRNSTSWPPFRTFLSCQPRFCQVCFIPSTVCHHSGKPYHAGTPFFTPLTDSATDSLPNPTSRPGSAWQRCLQHSSCFACAPCICLPAATNYGADYHVAHT